VPIRCDGFYLVRLQNNSGVVYHTALRFHEDATVVEVSFVGNPTEIRKWFHKDDDAARRGTYSTDGRTVQLTFTDSDTPESASIADQRLTRETPNRAGGANYIDVFQLIADSELPSYGVPLVRINVGDRWVVMPSGWLASGLGDLRPELADATYSLYPPDSLPPLDEGVLDGTLGWLTPDGDARPAPDHEVANRLRRILKQCQSRRIELPPAFERLMGSAELQERIPDATGCYFDLPNAVTAVDGESQIGGHIIRFLNDQQLCYCWYVWIRPDGTNAVISAGASEDKLTGRSQEFCLNAPSFESFLYRWWIENRLSLSLASGRPLIDGEERYAQFYRSRS
jgi:hypothetical protein